jgi:hypothetical protein
MYWRSMRCKEFEFPFIMDSDFCGDESLDGLLAVLTIEASAQPVTSADAYGSWERVCGPLGTGGLDMGSGSYYFCN